VTDDQSGLQGSFAFLDLVAPTLVIPHLIDSELFAQGVVTAVIPLDLIGVDHVFREHVDRPSDLLEQVARPDDLAGIWGHVSDNRRVGLLISEDSLDAVQFGSVIVENSVVLGSQLVLQRVSF